VSPGEQWCLTKILKDELRFSEDGELQIFHNAHKRWITKIAQLWRGRWRYSVGSRRSVVYKNRLLYLVLSREEIPDDCFVDHINENRQDDRQDNLQLHTRLESHQQGNRAQTQQTIYQLCTWFEFIAKEGRPPTSQEEQEEWENNWGNLCH